MGREAAGENPRWLTPRARERAEILLFALIYLALVDLSWRFLGPLGRPIYWFPHGFATGILLRVERRRWPQFLIAIPVSLILADVLGFPAARNPPLLVELAWDLESTVEPLAVAFLLERFLGRPVIMSSSREVIGLVLASVLIVPAVGAMIEGPVWWLWPEGRPAGSFAEAILSYTAIYSMPVLAFVPAIVSWNRPSSRPVGTILELVAIVVLAAVFTWLGFYLPGLAGRFVALSVAAFPLLGWTAARFGVSVAAPGAFVFSVIATFRTFDGAGPFGQAATGLERLVLIQAFSAVSMVTALLVAAEAASARAQAQRREQALVQLAREEQEVSRLYREAQEAVQVRDEFLSIASHELKTPITPLATRLQWLRREIVRGRCPEIGTIDKALASLGKLTALINDLLDASRIERGGLSLHAGYVDLASIARVTAVTAFAAAGPEHTLELTLPEAPVWIHGDPARIAQVVDNLISNAIKYSPRGGPVRLRAEASGEEAHLAVSDAGIGIPADELPRLFDRYFRSRTASATSYGGLGLGLYIVQDIVARHHGRVWAESEVGHGSTFFVALPLARPPIAFGATEPEAKAPT